MTLSEAGTNSLEYLTNGPAISGFGQKPNEQRSPSGGFRQNMFTNSLAVEESAPVRFKKFIMLSVTEQLSDLKTAGEKYPPHA